jgi:hypothetical protein
MWPRMRMGTRLTRSRPQLEHAESTLLSAACLRRHPLPIVWTEGAPNIGSGDYRCPMHYLELTKAQSMHRGSSPHHSFSNLSTAERSTSTPPTTPRLAVAIKTAAASTCRRARRLRCPPPRYEPPHLVDEMPITVYA